MIILFDENASEFTNLGLGVLKDAISCTVTEKLNDEFILEMEYPIMGSNYSKINIGRIIYAKPNPYDDMQPFRINSISKPIKGIVNVSACHISYDANGIPVKQIDAKTLDEVIAQIQNGAYIKNNFNIISNVFSSRTFKTTQPYNLRAILMGDKDNSLIGVYDAELKFDKYDIYMYPKRGKNRGAQVCYGYNMTDLKHQVNNDRLYNGVFPYYHTEKTSTETSTEDQFKQVYIVGSKPFQKDWLSYTKDGEPYIPLDDTPVQIASEGEYAEQVYSWNAANNRYFKKIYNETVTLIEGVIEPNWIKIEWKSFPVIRCVANANGYFKVSTDEDWGERRSVGDIVFEGNILQEGLSMLTSNMILYYSEVVPSSSESINEEVTEVIDVVLDDPIIWVNTKDAQSMKYNNILSLDLTSEFDDEPTKDRLRAKAEEYISKNLIGTVNHTTEVSFIDLQSTTEADRYTNFEHIELGDTVKVIYRELGVDVDLRVISTEYDVIAEHYANIELGVKEDNMSTNTIQNGDSISSLTNDAGYADITTVKKLIAETVTANYIQAANAKLTKAQIQELETAKITCTGIIEASQFILDNLVAELLTAENAKIANVLEAGTVKINGNLTMNDGSINLYNIEKGTVFRVDEDGNVEANSLHITGGTITLGNDAFVVDAEGNVLATSITITGGETKIGDNYSVSENGNVKINELEKCDSAKIDVVEISSNIKTPEINVGSANIGQKQSGSATTQTVRFDATWSLQSSTKYRLVIVCRETSSSTVVSIPETTIITGTVRYTPGVSSTKILTKKVMVTIPVGETNGYADVDIGEFDHFYGLPSGCVPATKEYTVYAASGITFDDNMLPRTDNMYDLGASDKRWKTVYAATGTINTSDARYKTAINYNIDRYSDLFDKLKPASFKMIDGTSGRTHLGFIAQDIKSTLDELNIDTTDFAGYIKGKNFEAYNKNDDDLTEDDYTYGLRYEEFISLIVYEVQKLKEEVKRLKEGSDI